MLTSKANGTQGGEIQKHKKKKMEKQEKERNRHKEIKTKNNETIRNMNK